MIELHRLENDTLSDEIDEKLTEMVVAYRAYHYAESSSCEEPLPHIRENDKIITGETDIDLYLEELSRELRQQRSVTGDGCYIDPETGKVC